MRALTMLRKEFDVAKQALDNSQVIAFPTETVMGLGVYFDDKKAYDLLNRVKCRPEDKPYTLMLGNVCDINKFAYVDERANKVINAFMPGEITILLRSKEVVPSYVTHGTGVIGIRVPNSEELLDFLRFINRPLLVPSANKSGEKPTMTSDEVKCVFKDELGFILNGVAKGGIPSTIIDLTGEQVKILREGKITLEQILKCI